MALETLSSSNNDFSNFIIYDTISATPFSTTTTESHNNICFLENRMNNELAFDHNNNNYDVMMKNRKRQCSRENEEEEEEERIGNSKQMVQGRKKRRRKPRVCKNKEEAETQRITHITVERNRRKQMNEHLAVLRSLMPESYVQRVCFVSFSFSLFVHIWIHDQLTKLQNYGNNVILLKF